MGEMLGMKERYMREKRRQELREQYCSWTENHQQRGTRAFPIYEYFHAEQLADLSGGALKLYIYLGLYSDPMTGECTQTTEVIAETLGVEPYTVKKWLNELKGKGLVEKIRGTSYTFLLPY